MRPKTVPELTSLPGAFSQGNRAQYEVQNSELKERCIRILVVDDHPVVRRGLAVCLCNHAGIAVVGEAADGAEAIRKVAELSPDLVLMDVEMPVMNGFAATETITKNFPKTNVLVVSMHNKPGYVSRAMQMGARGFALKTATPEDLLKAIDIVQRGEPFFSQQSKSNSRDLNRTPCGMVDTLFDREKEVLVYLATGYSSADIAELLGISVRTVESHRARLMRKLNIHSIAGLTKYAISAGYISLTSDSILTQVATDRVHLPALVDRLHI